MNYFRYVPLKSCDTTIGTKPDEIHWLLGVLRMFFKHFFLMFVFPPQLHHFQMQMLTACSSLDLEVTRLCLCFR